MTDAAFTYRMLQVIHDEDGQPHIVDADSSMPVNAAINIVTLLMFNSCKVLMIHCELLSDNKKCRKQRTVEKNSP